MKIILIPLLLITLYAPCFCQNTKIVYTAYNGFEDEQLKIKLDSAIKILEQIVNNDAFEILVKHTKYLRKNRKSNSEIYSLIKTGQEEESIADSIINLKLMAYESEKNEIGHTDAGDTIHTNKGYILENPAHIYASHLLHEYCHVLGFTHAFLRMPFRFMSVPYRIGTIVEKINITI